MATKPCTQCGTLIADSELTCPQCDGTDPETAKERGKWETLGCTAWIWIIPLMLLVTFLFSQCPLTR